MRFLFLFLLFTGHIVSAQDFSNKGTDFWVGYGSHISMYNTTNGSVNASGGLQKMGLYFTSDKAATVTVEIPMTGWKRTYSVSPNSITESDPIPQSGTDDVRLTSEGKSKKGIHITSTSPIVAYAHIYNGSISGATLLFPTNTLGKDYYTLGFTQVSNDPFSYPYCFVIATEDNTVVEITPSANTQTRQAGVAYYDTLQTGEILNLLGQLTGSSGGYFTGVDLTGTRIRSVSNGTAAGCKKIAVFSGTSKLTIRCSNADNGSADNTIQQAFPAAAWGKKYVTVPTKNMDNNYFRVMVKDAATVVKVNGTVISGLTANRFYQFQSRVANIIETDQPVMVAQYISTANSCGNTVLGMTGDPEMIYLSPVEQTIGQITVNSTKNFDIKQHYINVAIQTDAAKDFTLDGVNKTADFIKLSSDPGFSYAQFAVTAGIHTLSSVTGFNAIAYGYGNAESYGYNAGTSIRDFTPAAVFQNPYGRIDSAVTCANTPLMFSVPISFVPASIRWDFTAAPNLTPNAGISAATVTADSSRTINGQTLNYYGPGKTFSFSNANTSALRDTIKLYTTSSTPDGCGSNSQLFAIPVTVNEMPVAKFTVSGGTCLKDTLKFVDQSSISGGNIVRWLWDFGDGTKADIDSANVSPKVYTASASYTIRLKVISDIGCASTESTQPVAQTVKPVAGFTASGAQCPMAYVTFTDASTSVSPIVKWIWRPWIAGAYPGPELINTDGHAISVQYPDGGTKTPSLQVETASGCQSDTFKVANLYINQLPVVKFGLPEVCLSDAFALFTDSSTIADGTESQFKYAWKFNAGPPAVTPGPNIATSTLKNPQVKYAKSDNYVVELMVTSKDGCSSTLSQTFTVNGSIPKAAFDIANPAPYCGSRPVLLQNNSTVDFGSVTKLEIYWDYANNPAVKEVIETPVFGKQYTHAYADPSSPKNYTIRLVAYSGGAACSDGISKTITVYPLPKVAFTASAGSVCYGDVVSFTDRSYSGSSAITAWTWDLAKGDVSTQQNPKKQFNDSGLFSISMHFVNADNCLSDTVTQQLIVYPNPVLTLTHNITVLEGGTATLKPVLVYGHDLSYLWTPATFLNSDTAAMPKTMPDKDITYKLTLTGQGDCSATDTIFVRVLRGPEVPNAFSPNGDGINDTWKIKYLDGYPGASVEVYNRGGQIVFRETGYDIEWNGTINGNPLPVGTYYYIINPKNGRPVISGSVTIIK